MYDWIYLRQKLNLDMLIARKYIDNKNINL